MTIAICPLTDRYSAYPLRVIYLTRVWVKRIEDISEEERTPGERYLEGAMAEISQCVSRSYTYVLEMPYKSYRYAAHQVLSVALLAGVYALQVARGHTAEHVISASV